MLVHSRTDDRDQTVGFADDRWVNIPGGGAAIEATPEAVYLALSLRNVGAGLAVLQAWRVHSVAGTEPESAPVWRDRVLRSEAPDVKEFRPLNRDQ